MRKANEEKKLEACRKRLDKIVTTKIRTSFVGALAKFEEDFGFLWGHNKSIEQLTPEEKEMRELWDQTRTAVLNNGNNQLRGAQTEISMHVVSWNRYTMEMPFKPREEEKDA
jgi:hypothetical protein